jgi:hypothetical protein
VDNMVTDTHHYVVDSIPDKTRGLVSLLFLYSISLWIMILKTSLMNQELVISCAAYQDRVIYQKYHLCPRCFPYIDLYCELCEGHGEYLIINSETKP